MAPAAPARLRGAPALNATGELRLTTSNVLAAFQRASQRLAATTGHGGEAPAAAAVPAPSSAMASAAGLASLWRKATQA